VVVGEGFHERFGEAHAEVNALKAAGERAKGATLVVTLEPCCHTGKTPPCVEAVLAAGVTRVVIAMRDPFPKVDGGGIRALEAARVECVVGVLEDDARRLLAPYLKLVETGRPWAIAKWAMTLDGKIATHTGKSQWISSEASRALVHKVRGQVDAILVGRLTAERDDPLLTARPAGPRVATRIVLDSEASISLESQLVRTIDQAPLVIVTKETAPLERIKRLEQLGVEIFKLPIVPWQEQLVRLLEELGSRQMTNVMVEGGALVLGAFADIQAIDEVHVFIAPKLAGGKDAPSALAGEGLADMMVAQRIVDVEINVLDGDVHVHGFVDRA
jgi:diaminohydroxyphosphoribosylaminopyrimidine deaminase/5-amino-6-(5-phosphoribosylamino)uracil reductase